MRDLNKVEAREQYQLKNFKKVCSFGDLMIIGCKACFKDVGENIKISARESVGQHEQK